MPTFHFKGLLTENGWLENATVTTNNIGHITAITTTQPDNRQPRTENREPTTTNHQPTHNHYAFPGFQNSHSHAFQYAMAGLAEYHGGSGIPDDFWSWRNAMYNLALTLSPDDMQAVATMLYTEMLRHGYTSVAEFHYVHHDVNGRPYANLAEMGERLLAAAQTAGIRITLVPMFYQMGGFGVEATEKQRRFLSADIDAYNKLLQSSADAVAKYENAKLGSGIHSLRAVKPEDVITYIKDRDTKLPFHIHVSEQLKEIEDSIAYCGKRPVQWLLDNVSVDGNFHLVHATHLDDKEVKGIAESGANVVICPTTEGNLGDGLFRFGDYQNLNGNWSIGTDSHVSLNPMEELRLLDYGQRLITHKRTTFYKTGNGDSGFNAIKQSWHSGRKAMGETRSDFFEVGKPFDAVVLNANSPLVATAGLNNICNTFIYSSDRHDLVGTIVGGQWKVQSQTHQKGEEILANFTSVLKKLKTRS